MAKANKPPKSDTPDLRSEKNIDNLINGTSDVVMKAANILEEEIAAGIVMAKKVEEKFRSKNRQNIADNEELISRFRRDAHQIVDLFADMIHSGIKSFVQDTKPTEKNELNDNLTSTKKRTRKNKGE